MPFPSNKREATPSQNKIRVLRLIRNANEITRSDIIRRTGLSAPTITRTIETLLTKKLITTHEIGSSNGGRPPQIIRFNSQNNYVIGIDIAAISIRAAISDLDGNFLEEIHEPTQIDLGFEGVMEQLGKLINKLLQWAANKKTPVKGIGIAVCGLVNRHTGIVDYSPILKWKNADIKKALSAYTDLRIDLNNVAHLIALGELHYGIGKKCTDFISINLDYGIGAGIIINGQPFYGMDGYAGEIGHIVVDNYSKRIGREGIPGTLEAFASGYGIKDLILDQVYAKRPSTLSQIPAQKLNAKMVIDAAIQGDELALEVIDSAAEFIGIGIDVFLKLFNTQSIVISGDLAFCGGFFLDKIRTKVESLKLPITTNNVQIVASSFEKNAALMGAFSLILEKIILLKEN